MHRSHFPFFSSRTMICPKPQRLLCRLGNPPPRVHSLAWESTTLLPLGSYHSRLFRENKMSRPTRLLLVGSVSDLFSPGWLDE
jgi:hypothetical protein